MKKVNNIRNHTVRKIILKKARVKFKFITKDGVKLDNSNSRLKIAMDCGVGCYIKIDGSWKAVKGDLESIKMYYERVVLPGKSRKRK